MKNKIAIYSKRVLLPTETGEFTILIEEGKISGIEKGKIEAEGYEFCNQEQDETGSEEDSLPPKEAQQKIFQLNNQAQGEYQSSDLPAAMSCLRQALQLSVKHFGWYSPGVAYSLTNFGHVMRGTGNNDNILEVTSAINRMLYHWDNETPAKEEWAGAGSIMDQLIGVCNSLGKDGFAERLSEYKAKLC